jgi:hypothetical protein
MSNVKKDTERVPTAEELENAYAEMQAELDRRRRKLGLTKRRGPAPSAIRTSRTETIGHGIVKPIGRPKQ